MDADRASQVLGAYERNRLEPRVEGLRCRCRCHDLIANGMEVNHVVACCCVHGYEYECPDGCN